MRLDLEVFGDKQFSREILRVGQHAEDMSPAFDEVHELFLDTERKQFTSQGGAFSGGWQPLAPATRSYKARNNLDPRILHATLRLRNSLTEKTHVDHVFTTTPDSMFVGTKVPYAGPHQNPRSGNPLPRRRPVEFNDLVRRGLLKILQRHLLGSR